MVILAKNGLRSQAPRGAGLESPPEPGPGE